MDKTGNKKKLSRKATKFVAKLISNPDISITQAAKDAGYSVKTARTQGSAILTNLDIKAEIENSKAEVIEKAKYGLFEWISDLLEIKERCMQQIEVLDKLGHPTGMWRFDARGAIDAVDKLAKHFSFYAPDKINLTGDINIHEAQMLEREKEAVAEKIKEMYASNRIAQYIPNK